MFLIFMLTKYISVILHLLTSITGILCFAVYVPLCWIRKIQTLNGSHIFADIIIMMTVLIIVTFGVVHLSKHGWGKEVVAVNHKTYLDMLGFAVF